MRQRRRHVTIRGLMLAVAAMAVLSAVFRAVGALGFVVLSGYAAIIALATFGPWTLVRGNRQLAARMMIVASLVEFVALAGLGVFCLRYVCMVYKLFVSLIVLPFVAGGGAAWALAASRPGADRKRSPRVAWSVAGLLLALPLVMMFTYLPVQTAFLISRPALDRLADRVAAGGKVDRPEWAGLFLVRKIARHDAGSGTVSLVVENDSTGHTRLIRAATSDAEPQIPPAPSCFYRFAADKRWYHHELD
jgi:hypothetical protein